VSVEAKRAEPAEVRLAAESIDALLAGLAELAGAVRAPEPAPPQRLLSAAEVARWWGVERSWVYSHAAWLGVRRLGTGPRPRLRFDPEEVAERLGAPSPAPDMRRSRPIAADRRSDSLSARGGVIVVEQETETAGRRTNAPGPAPKEVLRRDTKPSPAGRSRRPFAAGFRGGDW
jgi:hypothetical protein